MSNPALRMIVRAIEDAEKLKYDVEAVVRVVVARRETPAACMLPLEELYAEELLALNMQRELDRDAEFENAAPIGRAA